MKIFIVLFISHIIVFLIGRFLSGNINMTENNYYNNDDYFDPDFGERSNTNFDNDKQSGQPTTNT